MTVEEPLRDTALPSGGCTTVPAWPATGAAAWNQMPDVRSPVGRTATELLSEGARRQALPGFEAGYRDIVDYIVRCTHRIWVATEAHTPLAYCAALYSSGGL